MIRGFREDRVCFSAFGFTTAIWQLSLGAGTMSKYALFCGLICIYWFIYWISAVAFWCSCTLFLVWDKAHGHCERTHRFLLLSDHCLFVQSCLRLKGCYTVVIWSCFCLFLSAERSSISLESTHAGKNGIINEGFEIEVCIWVWHFFTDRDFFFY